ncbi:MAG: recombination protein O N-terminal domain-containing protein [Paludibacteraceae bacterium]|nr:recombination protein O N-terminal domain-containing protein [Paludibacteraceae bacterium]
MLNTEAVVLAIQPYKDNASIVHLYTREQGRIQCLSYGKKFRFYPLTWIDIIAKQRSKDSFFYITYSALHFVPQQLSESPQRQSIALFVSEVLYKTLKHPMQDEQVFQFICQTIQRIDLSDSIETIHLDFLKDFSVLLGYGGEILEEWSNLKSIELFNMR